MSKRTFLSLLFIIIIFGFFIHITAFAADTRIDSLWLENGGSIVSIDVLKTDDASYGLEFTAPKYDYDPTCLVSGYYSANGMIRLTANDELVLSDSWIDEDDGNSSGYIRADFSRNTWHNIKAVYDKSTMTAEWYLDDVLIGATEMRTSTNVNCVSVYTQSGKEDGVRIGERKLLTDAQENASVVKKYTGLFGKTQGKNNWYFCEFGKNSVYDLNWNEQSGYWETLTGKNAISSECIGADSVMGIGYKFVAPNGGDVRLRGDVSMPYADSASGDGCMAYIYHQNNLQWKRPVIYGVDTEYDFALTVDSGDEIYFVIDCGSALMMDWVKWIPTVEYTDIVYGGETDYNYYRKQGVGRQSLAYDSTNDAYITDDGAAFISSNKIKLGSNVRLGKRYVVPHGGRYRVYGYALPDDAEGETVITVLKNSEEVWKQMFPEREKGMIDVRLFVESGDKIDIEITTDCPADKEISYRCEITKFIGTLFCDADTSCGYEYRTEQEYTMEAFLKKLLSENRAEFYSVKNDLKYNMTYSNSLDRWICNIPESNGYISKKGAFSGYDTDSVIELELSEDGILRIDGDLRVCDYGDGVISKIYLNDRLLWSSRVGGERPVRWDEPYDVSYFLNRVNVVAEVKQGDKLNFTFDQWRKAKLDEVDFSDLKIRYISGEVLSDTTKWKLRQSVVVDIGDGAVYIDGVRDNADVFADSGTAYIAKKDAVKLTGTESERSDFVIDGKEYLPIRDVLEDEGKNVVWAADRLVIGYDGIPVLFGYPELSELETVLCSENIREYAELKAVDRSGIETDKIISGETYSIKSMIENYVGDDVRIRYITAYYDDSKILQRIVLSEEFIIGTGEVFDTENISADSLPDIIPDGNTAEVKVFACDGTNMMKPYVDYLSLVK